MGRTERILQKAMPMRLLLSKHGEMRARTTISRRGISVRAPDISLNWCGRALPAWDVGKNSATDVTGFPDGQSKLHGGC